jgi:DNA-binding LytR/AlgR family response regulator
LPGTGDWVDRLVVRIGSRDLVIAIEEVELLEADDVHVRIHARGRRYQMRQSLDALAALLDPSRFARVHRSYVVPISRIAAVRRRRGGAAELELHTGTRVPVSRRRRGVLDRLGASEARG